MADAEELSLLEQIIAAAREVPEEEHGALLELVLEFKRNLDERNSRWAGFTGIISDEDAGELFAAVAEPE